MATQSNQWLHSQINGDTIKSKATQSNQWLLLLLLQWFTGHLPPAWASCVKARDELRAENPAAGTWSALIQMRVSTLGKYQARHKSRTDDPSTPEGMVSPNPSSHSLGRSNSRSRRASIRDTPDCCTWIANVVRRYGRHLANSWY